MSRQRRFQKSKLFLLRCAVLLVLAATLSGCGIAPAAPQPDTSITVQLSWLHYASFGGLYAADQNGTYHKEGLAVSFQEGGPDVDLIGAVVDGDAQFGVVGADDLLLARAEGEPVRAIATILRRNPVVFVVQAETGITRPEDFAGHTVRITPQIAPSFHTMMDRVGVPRDAVETVVLPSDVDTFASGEADVWGVYDNSFAITLEQAGYDLNKIWPSDYGAHFYNDTLYTTDRMIEENPDLVLRFLRATLEGYTFAVENPEEIGSMVTQYEPNASAALENAKMVASIPLIHTGANYIGWMENDVWQQMHDTLLAEEMLPGPVELDTVYTVRFLNEIYGETP